MNKISLSPIEATAFYNLQREFNQIVMEIVRHRGEDIRAQWSLSLHDSRSGFLVKVGLQPEPEELQPELKELQPELKE